MVPSDYTIFLFVLNIRHDPEPKTFDFLRFVWQLRPKHHIMAHLAHDMSTRLYNVRYEHCFRDESAIGVAKGILKALVKSQV